MVPEARNIPQTFEVGNKRLNLESEGCKTKVVSVFIILLIAWIINHKTGSVSFF